MNIAISFDRLGPYHCSRISRISRGMDLTAIEIFRKDDVYDWSIVPEGNEFRRITMFDQKPNGNWGSILEQRLNEALNQIAPAVVAIHGWYDPAALRILRWCRKNRVPSIVMSASTALDAKRTPAREWLKSRIVRQNAAALVGGQRQKEYAEALGIPSDSIFDGYDTVDNNYFSNAATSVREKVADLRSHLKMPDRFFLASCRFIEKKNLFRLLEAFQKYRSRGNNWSLVIVGDGELKTAVERRSAELSLEESLLLPGFIQYERLPEFYGMASAFILPSTSEQWGLVVNEAMASRLPVLVSNRCGCAPDLVHSGINGWSFDPLNIEEMTDCLERISKLTEPERAAMGQASFELIGSWGPDRFAMGFQNAVAKALAVGSSKYSLLDQAALEFCIRMAT